MPAQFYLSATRKSSGKTTLSIGLSAALSNLGNHVQCYKKGPDYIDPLWLSQASGNATYNLDYNTQSEQEILNTYASQANAKDILIVEGNKGLFDGVATDGSNSNAALAKLLNIPVVLVIDCQGMSRGIAPLLQGYIGFDEQIKYAGIILNKTGGSRHEKKLINAVSTYTDLAIFGCLGRDGNLEIEERHLGLIPANERQGAKTIITDIAESVAKNIDLQALVAATQVQQPEINESLRTPAKYSGLSIAIPRDSAFGFYYADDLQRLHDYGVQVKYFNTLTDAHLPICDGLFIGGGFPETHSVALADNQSLKSELKVAIENGLPTYAECGGLMYLCRQIMTAGKSDSMVGIIPANIAMNERPQGRGYCTYEILARHPWYKSGQQSSQLKAHEFHYAQMQHFEPQKFAYRVNRGYGINGSHDGLVTHNLLANFVHLRHTEQNPWLDHFLEFIKEHKGS